jgi:Protein of unknown function (DUF559)
VGVCGLTVFADVETKTRAASSLCVPPLDCVCGPRPPPRPSPFQGEEEGSEGRAMSVPPSVRPSSSSPCKGEDRWGSAASRFSRRPEATARARSLRRAATQAERKLWYVLQRGQMSGLSFRRQHPLGGYVMDFYCPAIALRSKLMAGSTTVRLAVLVTNADPNGCKEKASLFFGSGTTTCSETSREYGRRSSAPLLG